MAVEFALVLPMLPTLVFGIIEFGRLYNAQIVFSNAAREGARRRLAVQGWRQ
ncbi:TadE family protein [Sinomonas mesophila]|uniref:TadE family protein n=1 Tax=Sinomonas mesophila TaxID=1531955 RepID=UPI0009861918